MTQRKVEILSPAGSFDSIMAAIHAGADAVYFGVEQLNMRTRSTNSFCLDDLAQIANLAREHGIKAYLTLNTVMYEHDMQLLKTILQEVKKQGIHAVIAADFAVMQYCKEMCIPLHVSTQANVSNLESVQFFAQFADLVVLARELTLKQVAHITKEIKRRNITGPSGQLIKIEIFVHGALCMAISGKCYLSLHEQNAAANRGACVQNCRRSYIVKDAETNEELLIDNEYIMSPQDLCTISILDQILDAGVDVLKIEDRSKGAEYVDTVTSCYKEAAIAVLNNDYTQEKKKAWLARLRKVYNRGFWEGYYLGRKLGEWTSEPGSKAEEKKIYLGKGTNYYPKIQVGEFLVESGSLAKGDTILVLGPTIGMAKETMQQLIVNGVEADSAAKGDKITFPIASKIGAMDKLYKLVKA